METKNQIITGLVFGALIGTVAAMLLAPRSGKENRAMLRGRIGWVKDKVRRNRGDRDMDLEGAFQTRADYLH